MFTGELDEIFKRLNAEWTQFKVLTLTDTAVQLPPLSVTVVELEPIYVTFSLVTAEPGHFSNIIYKLCFCVVW